MEKTGWKILAIVSTILLILSLIALGFIFLVGGQYEYNRQVCAYSICQIHGGEHDAYFYADKDNSCFCFTKGNLDFIEDIGDFLERGG